MHFRRDDLQFEDQRKVTPAQVFNTTYDYYNANDTIYVSTDEVPSVCQLLLRFCELECFFFHFIFSSVLPFDWIHLPKFIGLRF
jgi:hypothetical protein